jgi:hypothetical protein
VGDHRLVQLQQALVAHERRVRHRDDGPRFVATLNERLFESDFESSRILTEPRPVTSGDLFAEALAHQQ